MSITTFNRGMDDCANGGFPNHKLMEKDRDYFAGWCYAEDIEGGAEERQRDEERQLRLTKGKRR